MWYYESSQIAMKYLPSKLQTLADIETSIPINFYIIKRFKAGFGQLFLLQ